MSGIESSPVEKKQKPGKIVNEFIENAKSEVNKYKQEVTEGLNNIDDIGE
tara:strand:+ start:543 stop:692 length:150 start_codon:yes stop_codon:yes gene_type:complete